MKLRFLFLLLFLPIFTMFGQDGDFDADYHKVWFSYKTFPELSCIIVKKTYSNELPKSEIDSLFFLKKKEKIYFRNETTGWEYFLDNRYFILFSPSLKECHYKELKGNDFQKYFRFLIGSEIEYKIKNKDSVVFGGTNERQMKYVVTNRQKPVSTVVMVIDTLSDIFKELHYVYFREKAYTQYTYHYVKNEKAEYDAKCNSAYYYSIVDKKFLLSDQFKEYYTYELGKKKKKKKKASTK